MCRRANRMPTQSPTSMHHVRLSPEPTMSVRHYSKAHRRGLSMDSFFADVSQTNAKVQCVAEERGPPFFVGSSERDWWQLHLPDSVAGDAARSSAASSPPPSRVLPPSSFNSRPKSGRSQSCIPTIPGLFPSPTNGSLPASSPMAPTRARRLVRFSPNATVRQYDVTIGDVYSPNYDGSMNRGLPLSLGWNYCTVEAVVTVPTEDTFTKPVRETHVPSKGKLRERTLYLSPKQRFAILKVRGGYTEKELLKIQRELTLRDRHVFFNG